MKTRLILVLLAAAAAGHAETRRALLIGINVYEPLAGEKTVRIIADPRAAKLVPGRPVRTTASFRNLHGAVNDAVVMKRVLIDRFGFNDANVRLLKDRQATRAAILDAIPTQLMPATAKKGDIAVLFFAGHGSEVLNSKSTQPDHLDQSLVPADSYRGVPDIRNKEIARLLNAMIDRGLVVTFIADSCHSGAIARGVRTGGSRLLEYDPRDAADAGYAGQPPQQRGALIVSSTQSNQEAKETADGSHGVFTWALTRVLNTVSPAAPVSQVFQQTHALLQSEVSWQEPVMAGAGRTDATLIGLPAAPGGGSDLLAVRGPAAGGRVLLEGALAATLNPGCELAAYGARAGEPAARLRVVKVLNLTQVEAEPAAPGGAEMAKGALFELARWVVPETEALRVLVPQNTPPRAELERVARALEPLRRGPGVEWVDDPSAVGPPPTHVLRWDRTGGWLLDSGGAIREVLPAAGTVGALLGARARLLVVLPPFAELSAALRIGPGSPNEAIRSIGSMTGRPHYVLAGRWRNSRLEYAWVAPDATEDVASRMTLPVRSNWEPAEQAARLEDYAARIQKLRCWLRLASPPASAFPYRLVLRNAQTGIENTSGTLVEDDEYRLALKADAAELKRLEDDGRLNPRFIYVFTIDRRGKSTLLYPPLSTGNEGNRLPRMDGPAPALIELGGKDDVVQVSEPFGVDSYILLATATALPNPGVLEFDGVETAVVRRGNSDPLEELLVGVGSERRRGPQPAPAKWAVTRSSFLSIQKKQ